MKRNLNDLFYFITVTREGSLTRAEAQPGGRNRLSARQYRRGNIGCRSACSYELPVTYLQLMSCTHNQYKFIGIIELMLYC